MLKQTAVDYYGTQEKVAQALNVKRQSVQGWGDLVPLGRAYQLQVLTRGKLRVVPELYQAPLDQARA